MGSERSARHRHRHLLSLNFATSREIQCVSCHLEIEPCTYADAHFHPNGQYYEFSCLGPDVPSVHVVESASHQIVNTLRSVVGAEREVRKIMRRI